MKYLKIIALLLFVCFYLPSKAQNKASVDYISDFTKFINQGDSTILKLTGNVAFYHNGAFMTCDSAYRYTESHIEGFGSVLINQDDLYIYADRIEYNSETNIARVFSPLVKVVDSMATMYTYNMLFNTDNSLCEYFGGATTSQEGNIMESKNGFFYSNERKLILKNSVEIKNIDYEVSNEKLDVDLNTEAISFDVITNIWSGDERFLQADKGNYTKEEKNYNFYKNSYILTEEQEGWADTMVYYSIKDEVQLQNNIQLDDDSQNLITFGDYGYYWNNLSNAVIRKNPSLVMYDDNRDTTFTSGDTIILIPFLNRIRSQKVIDSLIKADSIRVVDSMTRSIFFADSLSLDSITKAKIYSDSLIINGLRELLADYGYDSTTSSVVIKDTFFTKKHLIQDTLGYYTIKDTLNLRGVADSLRLLFFKDVVISDSIKIRYRSKEDLTVENIPIMYKVELDTIFKGQDIFTLKSKDYRSFERPVKRSIKRRIKEFKKIYKDSLTEANRLRRKANREGWINDINAPNTTTTDTTLTKIDSTVLDKEKEMMVIDNVADSSDFIVRVLHNARIYRDAMQSLSDSIIVETVDSTMTFIDNAIAWNDINEITAKRIRTYIKNGDIDRSRLFGDPIVAQYVGVDQYNQLTGEYMDALYKDNVMNKLLVNSKSETVFYREEMDSIDNEKYVVALTKTKSKNMIIDMDSSMISRIKWISSIESVTYPIEMVPTDLVINLPNFKWYDTLRPTKKDVFDRVVRTTRRAQMDSIQRPTLPITNKINAEKIRLIKGGLWRDRNELINVTIEDFKR